MGYYMGLLLTGTILHILYKYPLKNEEGIFATLMREQVLSGTLQSTAVFTQLMIIVGLYLDGGRSLTSRDKIKSWESHLMKNKYHTNLCQVKHVMCACCMKGMRDLLIVLIHDGCS